MKSKILNIKKIHIIKKIIRKKNWISAWNFDLLHYGHLLHLKRQRKVVITLASITVVNLLTKDLISLFITTKKE